MKVYFAYLNLSDYRGSIELELCNYSNTADTFYHNLLILTYLEILL